MGRLLTQLGCITLLAFAPFAGTAAAEGNEGYRIAARSQKVSFGYQSLTASWDMVISRNDTTTGERQMTVRLLEQAAADAHDMGLIEINEPTSLRGTKLLSWSSADGDDQQWLYMPRSQRTRRIGDRGRYAAFVNSTFSFEDLLKWQLDAYAYQFNGNQTCTGGTCAHVTATAVKRASKYSRLEVLYDSEHRIRQIDYFRDDDAAKPWKTLVVGDYLQVGDTWQPTLSTMTDHESGVLTRITASDYRLDANLTTADFSPHNL